MAVFGLPLVESLGSKTHLADHHQTGFLHSCERYLKSDFSVQKDEAFWQSEIQRSKDAGEMPK
jgi:hypothetical protein